MSTSTLTPHQTRLERKQAAMRSRERRKADIADYEIAKAALTVEQVTRIRKRVAAHVLLLTDHSYEEIARKLKVSVQTIVDFDKGGRRLF